MKAVVTLALVAAFVSLSIVDHAHAGGQALTTPGAVCALQGPATLEGLLAIRVSQRGVSNNDPQVRRDVVCPVMRSGEGDKLAIFVDGEAGEGSARVACRVQSRRIDGELLAQKTFVATTTPFSTFVLFEFVDAPQFSYQTVICTLPPNGQGMIYGITALES